MKLIERAACLAILHEKFDSIMYEGHCILVSGEAGIGKTSLLKVFCQAVAKHCTMLEGTCDAMFTPRPLAPLYDLALQMESTLLKEGRDLTDRAGLFTNFLHELESQPSPLFILIEDVHWADEATLDFIKFLARRINRLHCLLVLTYRDNEIHSQHPLRNVLGQLQVHSFTRLPLNPLSKEAVAELATKKGYNGEDIYRITGGNPFYVTEILANYSHGVPDNIKDSILSVYNHMDKAAKSVLNLLSVLPTGLEVKYLQRLDHSFFDDLQYCLDLKIIITKEDALFFKHELYRITIESSLSPYVRMALNSRILALFRESFEANGEIERIVHHAKAANEYNLVVAYAPVAAEKAACLGAHTEAAKLYRTAIEFYQGQDAETLLQFYEPYAYECYLTNQLKEAIIYASRSLSLLKEKADLERIGHCLNLLSRFWWFDGYRKESDEYTQQAVDLFSRQPPSMAKAIALGNMAHLNLLADRPEASLFWGEKAIEMAKELNYKEMLCFTMTSVGTVLYKISASRHKGWEMLQQSLDISLNNSFHEQVGLAYLNIVRAATFLKDYTRAKATIETALRYCEESDLITHTRFLFAQKAVISLETGNWEEAYSTAHSLIEFNVQKHLANVDALCVMARINMRMGKADILPLLQEAKETALRMEMAFFIPMMVAYLEYEWITGNRYVEEALLEKAVNMVMEKDNSYPVGEFSFWLLKARPNAVAVHHVFEGYQTDTPKKAKKAAVIWKKLGCPYEQALALFEGSEEDKRTALDIADKLNATAIFEKMKFLMRASGIKQLPKGIRKSTRSNPANLTGRELDVLSLLKEGMANKEIAGRLFVSPKTVDHHISSIFFKLDVNSRSKALHEARRLNIIAYEK